RRPAQPGPARQSANHARCRRADTARQPYRSGLLAVAAAAVAGRLRRTPRLAVLPATVADAAAAKQPGLRVRRPLAAPRSTGPASAASPTPGRGGAALRQSAVARQ